MLTRFLGGLLLLGAAAFATPIGSLSTSSCAGAGITVTATTIDWLPAGPPTGCIQTGDPTTITYSGGVLSSGVSGTIKDLPTLPLTDFMAFATAPTLHFNLSGIGPGPSNTGCAGLAVFESCAVFAGSPFSLQLRPGGQTVVALRAFGVATDATGSSTWDGGFSVTIPDMTPAAIQAIILAAGSITSTHSGSFVLTAIPEPATSVLLGAGLVAFSLIARRRWSA